MRRSAFSPSLVRATAAALGVVVVLVAIAPIRAEAAEPAQPLQNAPRVKLLVKFAPGGGGEGAAAVQRARARLDRAIPALGVHVVSTPAADAGRALATLVASPAVEWAEPDGRAEAFDAVPNDVHWAGQWGPGRTQAPKAWDRTTGDPSVVVAVLDTGVDATHPDLSGALVAGTDLVNGDADPADDNGHGTAVAGIVAARTNNLSGIAAYCWSCRVMPVKVLGADGSGSMSTIAEGVTWAVDRGARVINLSLGGARGSKTAEQAVSYARSKGAVVVAAAGNDGTTDLTYPAAYPGVVSVAATDVSDARYGWSNYGSWVQLAAPGCHTASLRGGTYGSFCGTSSAAPAVAGIAALALAVKPAATGASIEHALYSTAAPVGSFVVTGRVDANATVGAMTTATAPGSDVAADPVSRLAGDDRVTTAIALSRDSYPSGGASSVVISRSDSYADALAGTPLAVARNAPLLLTGQDRLDARTRSEVQRVLPAGAHVYLLGGPFAIAAEVERELVSLGYLVVRYAGENRFETAVAVAELGLGNPGTLFLATGTDFRDALVAGAAAPMAGAAVLLTEGSSMPSATRAYLAAHPGARRYAVGAPAVTADPTASAVAGADYVETSRKVAETFFTAPSTVAVATVANFPDALGGGAHIGRQRGPLVLSDPQSLSPAVAAYLTANRASLATGYIDGGTAAVSDNVQSAVRQAIS